MRTFVVDRATRVRTITAQHPSFVIDGQLASASYTQRSVIVTDRVGTVVEVDAIETFTLVDDVGNVLVDDSSNVLVSI